MMETILQKLSREVDLLQERAERRGAYRAITALANQQVPLGQLLVWRMCSDPWPGGDMAAIDNWLNQLSRAAGFSDWVDAYHRQEQTP